MRRLRASAFGFLLLAVTTACGGGGDTVTTPPPGPGPGPTPTPSFTLSVGSLASITQGDSVTLAVTITRSGGFAGAVSLTLSGAPNGVESQLGAIAPASSATSTTIKLNVGLGVTPGSFPLTVRAEATGVTAQTAPLSLTVTKRRAVFGFIRKSPNDQLSVNRGGLPLIFVVGLTQSFTFVEATLSVASGLPTGSTATFSPSVTFGGESLVTITVDTTALAGNYVAIFHATAVDADTVLLSVPFVVLGVARMEVDILQPTLTVARNSSSDANMDVRRFNYDQLFTLNTSALPTDVTLTFERIVNSIPTTSYLARFTAGANAPLGVYPVVITATAAGVQSGVDTIAVTIAPASTGGATAFRFCGSPEDIPIWFGIGRHGISWVRILPDANNTFAFDVGIKNNVAWVTQRGADDFAINVVAGNEAELNAFSALQCASPSNRSVTGSVANLAATDTANVAFGPRSAGLPPVTAASPTFALLLLPDGAQDLLAVRRRVSSGTTATIDRMLIRRGLNPANGAALSAIDFLAAESFTPTTAVLRVSGLQGNESPMFRAMFETGLGGQLLMGTSPVASPDSLRIATVPLSAQLLGDLHRLSASGQSGSGVTTVLRTISRHERVPANATLALGPVPEVPSVSLSNSNPQRARYWAFITYQAEYGRMFATTWSQQVGATRRMMSITHTEAVVGRPGRRRLEAPDFTGAPGFDVLWEMRPGTNMTWTVQAFGWDAIGGLQAPRGDGVVTRQYTVTGELLF